MGSKTFKGVRFSAYVDDHDPPHVHGFYAQTEIVMELLIAQRAVRLAIRDDNVRPRNAKRSDTNHIRKIAQKHFDELVTLWENAR